jgi:hypothetical protein
MCVTAAAFLGLCPTAGLAESGLSVRVKATRSNESLEIAVVNQAPGPVRIASDALPWVSPYRGFRLVVVPMDPHANPLGLVVHWDEPVEAPVVVLEPGKPRVGEIDLGAWFKGFAQARRKSELLVFWSWLPDVLPHQPQERLGGWLVLPKASQGVR